MRRVHAAAGRIPAVAKGYLTIAGAVLRHTPPLPLKSNLINNLTSAEWPDLRFGGRSVEVCPGVVLTVVPHVGEFDFAALFARRLDYETCVFRTLNDRLDRYDAVLDIGANVGVYTVFFATAAARRNRPAVVYAFEPSRLAYARLLENLRLNGVSRVAAFNAAVSDRSGFTAFFEPEGHLTNGSLDAGFAGIFSSRVMETIVPSVGHVEIEQLARPHESLLLKIDVEGAESVVLAGLAELIRAKRPEIVLEVLDPQVGPLNELTFLRDAYDFYLITDTGLQSREHFAAHPSYRDYLLLPRNRA